jgi:C4-dicarboxylate transporter DctQ subunit
MSGSEKKVILNGLERNILTFDKHLLRVEELVSAFLLLGVVITVLVGIVLRFVLRIPNLYGEEISRYLLLACVFIGISIGVRKKSHLGVDSIVNALPQKISRKVCFMADALTAVTYGLLSILSYRFVIIIKGFGQTSPAITALPMYAVYSLLLTGFILSFVHSFMMIWNDYFAVHKILSSKEE